MASQSSDNLTINSTVFNPDEDIAYAKPRINKVGGKSVGIINKHTSRQLMITTPLMLTWGVNERQDEKSGRVTYDMSLQFPKDDYATEATTKFLDSMKEFESKIKSDVIKNSKTWMNKANLNEAQVDVLFHPLLYYPKDRETGEPLEGRSPTLKVKLDYWDDNFTCEIYNVDKKQLFPCDHDQTVSPVDLLTKGSNVACIIKCGGIWFANGKCGVTWKLVQAVVQPRASISGRCFIELSDGDKKTLKDQAKSDTKTDMDDDHEHGEGVDIVDDTDDEANSDEEEEGHTPTLEAPSPPVEDTPPSPPVETTKKRRVVRRKKSS